MIFRLKFLFSVFALMLLVTSCTEIELAAHMAKQIPPQSPSQGTFKVGSPYKIFDKMYYPQEVYSYTETGIASWYGPNFHGKSTANGEIFDQNELTAAHRTLQLPSLVRVTNLENGRSLIVRINDRGPFKRGRVIDLSKRAAELLGYRKQGTARVKIEILPEESKAIAQAAKRGEDTGGIEIAMNENRFAKPRPVSFELANGNAQAGAPIPPRNAPNRFNPPAPSNKPTGLSPQPAEAMYAELQPAAASPSVAPEAIPGHVKSGKFYPDPLVQQAAVVPSNIFVQAGAFSDSANAYSYADTLRKYGNARVFQTNIHGKSFFRVRFGPMSDVSAADALLNQLASAGQNDAIIVVVD